jgi:hypothetical protein
MCTTRVCLRHTDTWNVDVCVGKTQVCRTYIYVRMYTRIYRPYKYVERKYMCVERLSTQTCVCTDMQNVCRYVEYSCGPYRSVEPTQVCGTYRSVEPTQACGPYRSVEPTQACGTYRSVEPTQVCGTFTGV